MENRSGKLIRCLSGDMSYQYFLPARLPPMPSLVLDDDSLQLLIKANKEVAYLDGLSSKIPSLPLFVSMYVRKEALLSSQIEGTQATLEDILDPDIDKNANRDVCDVVNYIKAIRFAVERRCTLPLCNRLLKETHSVLMSGVRGNEKSPGEFRTTQNWIGATGCSLKNARYVPPAPDEMLNSMSDLEKYINMEDDETDPLVRAGLAHYQFETIHPFLDGNGRIGRLLITLLLLEQNVLSTPVLYLSCFLKQNRTEYYDRMTEVRRKGDYEQWIRFFLEAISGSAEDAIANINMLSALHDESVSKISGTSKNQNLTDVFEYIEKNPIIGIKKTASDLGIAYNTVSKAVDTLVKLDILSEDKKRGRTRIYSYAQYLDILRKDTL